MAGRDAGGCRMVQVRAARSLGKDGSGSPEAGTVKALGELDRATVRMMAFEPRVRYRADGSEVLQRVTRVDIGSGVASSSVLGEYLFACKPELMEMILQVLRLVQDGAGVAPHPDNWIRHAEFCELRHPGVGTGCDCGYDEFRERMFNLHDVDFS